MPDTDQPVADLTDSGPTGLADAPISLDAELAQSEPEGFDQMSPELLDELPPGIVEDLRDGSIDQIPESVIEKLPTDLADTIPDALVAGATSNPLLAFVLVGVGILALLGAVWGVIKGLIKLAVFLAVVAAAAWFWFFAR